MFSFLSFPEIPHLITLANGSKVVSQGIGQVSPFASLNLRFVLLVPTCPFNLISLSQLTNSLICSKTFDGPVFIP